MFHWRWHLMVIALFVVFALLQHRLWFQPGGVRDLLLLKKMLAVQTDENARLKQRNEALLFQVQRIQNSKDAVESHARNELGMIKKDEKFYQIVP
jgi:cell division protein FtsB